MATPFTGAGLGDLLRERQRLLTVRACGFVANGRSMRFSRVGETELRAIGTLFRDWPVGSGRRTVYFSGIFFVVAKKELSNF